MEAALESVVVIPGKYRGLKLPDAFYSAHWDLLVLIKPLNCSLKSDAVLATVLG